MQLNKIRVCIDVSNRLKFLKGKTGLTPNILSRLGFCLSLNDPSIPDPSRYPEDGKEFNRYTLLGEWDNLFMALLKERCRNDGLDLEKDLKNQFHAHLNRGVLQLHNRVKDLSDFAALLSSETLKERIHDP